MLDGQPHFLDYTFLKIYYEGNILSMCKGYIYNKIYIYIL
jgi:hypothetical protein